jgi:hypothetical protein
MLQCSCVFLTPKMRTPRYYTVRMADAGLAPTVSLPMQTDPYSGHISHTHAVSITPEKGTPR